MGKKMHINILLNHRWAATPHINIKESIETTAPSTLNTARYASASYSSTVNISEKANALSKTSDSSAMQKANGLRKQISKIDFHNTTQVEMSNLVSDLVQNREITPDQASLFISAATDMIPPRGPSKKFDLTKHFETVKRILDEGVKTNPNLRWGASYAASEIDVLNKIQSFAKSIRIHIMGSD